MFIYKDPRIILTKSENSHILTKIVSLYKEFEGL